MIADRTASSLVLKIFLRDDAGDPITGITHDDSDLELSLWKHQDTAWSAQSLIPGTLGDYTENGWVEIGEGLYEYGLPGSFILPGRRTDLRVKYNSNRPQFDSVSFVAATPAASLRFGLQGTGPIIRLDAINPIFIKEKDLVAQFTANENIEGLELEVVFEEADQIDIVVVPDGDLTKDGDKFTLVLPEELTDFTRTINWAVRVVSTQRVLGQGSLPVDYAPFKDTL